MFTLTSPKVMFKKPCGISISDKKIILPGKLRSSVWDTEFQLKACKNNFVMTKHPRDECQKCHNLQHIFL